MRDAAWRARLAISTARFSFTGDESGCGVDARLAIFEFIEGWYNPHRRHSAVDYLSPINYERSHFPMQ